MPVTNAIGEDLHDRTVTARTVQLMFLAIINSPRSTGTAPSIMQVKQIFPRLHIASASEMTQHCCRAQGRPHPHSGVCAMAEHARPRAACGVPPILARPEPARPRRDRRRSAPSAVNSPTCGAAIRIGISKYRHTTPLSWPRGLRPCIVYVKLCDNY